MGKSQLDEPINSSDLCRNHRPVSYRHLPGQITQTANESRKVLIALASFPLHFPAESFNDFLTSCDLFAVAGGATGARSHSATFIC
jgi:hypothetical protein